MTVKVAEASLQGIPVEGRQCYDSSWESLLLAACAKNFGRGGNPFTLLIALLFVV